MPLPPLPPVAMKVGLVESPLPEMSQVSSSPSKRLDAYEGTDGPHASVTKQKVRTSGNRTGAS